MDQKTRRSPLGLAVALLFFPVGSVCCAAPTPVLAPAPDEKFAKRDRDEDGALSEREFVGARTGGDRTWALRYFYKRDRDDDEFLTPEEFAGKPGPVSPGGQFRLMDADSDGELSEAEFVGPKEGGKWHDAARRNFGRFDVDDSGSLSPDEFRLLPKYDPDAGTLFEARDQNGDGTLDREEYVAPFRDKNQFADVKRNFYLYDADADGAITLEEFVESPRTPPSGQRGRVADPLVKLAEKSASDFEAWLDAHDRNDDDRLERSEFEKIEPAAPGADRWGTAFEQWDRDGDGSVSAVEARTAAEIAYGVRRPDGEPLRTERGRISEDQAFRDRDVDGDDRLSLEEFGKYRKRLETAEEPFAKADADGDGLLTFAEFGETPAGSFDAVRAYKNADSDEDGRLSLEEFLTMGRWGARSFNARSFAVFDANGDGFLNFQEYRGTPAANPVGSRLDRLKDVDGDGRLSAGEFAAGWEAGPPALSAWYFQRFDGNGDRFLKPHELPFEVRWDEVPPEAAFAAKDADGDGRLNLDEFYHGPPRVPDRFVERTQGYQRRLMQVEDAFRAGDADRDGLLTLAEFRAADQAEADKQQVKDGPRLGIGSPAVANAEPAASESEPGLGGWVIAVIAFDVMLLIGVGWAVFRWRRRKSSVPAGPTDGGAA